MGPCRAPIALRLRLGPDGEWRVGVSVAKGEDWAGMHAVVRGEALRRGREGAIGVVGGVGSRSAGQRVVEAYPLVGPRRAVGDFAVVPGQELLGQRGAQPFDRVLTLAEQPGDRLRGQPQTRGHGLRRYARAGGGTHGRGLPDASGGEPEDHAVGGHVGGELQLEADVRRSFVGRESGHVALAVRLAGRGNVIHQRSEVREARCLGPRPRPVEAGGVGLGRATLSVPTVGQDYAQAMSIGEGPPADAECELSWVAVLPECDRRLFAEEMSQLMAEAAETDDLGPVEQALREWRVTAEIYLDPELLKRLTGPRLAYGERVPRPVV